MSGSPPCGPARTRLQPLLGRQLGPQLGVDEAVRDLGHVRRRRLGRAGRDRLRHEAAGASLGAGDDRRAVTDRRPRGRQDRIAEAEAADLHRQVGHQPAPIVVASSRDGLNGCVSISSRRPQPRGLLVRAGEELGLVDAGEPAVADHELAADHDVAHRRRPEAEDPVAGQRAASSGVGAA
jgi:hypothetical protein